MNSQSDQKIEDSAPMWALLRGTGRCNRHSLPLEAKGKTVVEEKQLAVRQQTAEQGVQALALQQDLRRAKEG